MIVTIHQPEHLPWLGFFHKADRAELLVLLDVVQYRKDYFQNRNRILGQQGPVWLTVPVVTRGYMDASIADIRVNTATVEHNRSDWRRDHLRRIRHGYGRHPFFAEHVPFLEDTYARDWELLVDLNEHLIGWFLDTLGIATPVVRASTLGGLHGARSELLLEICRRSGATTYISGHTGREYLDEEIFRSAGIEVEYDAFEHPRYPQMGSADFVSHLSTLDLVLNVGPASLDVIRRGSATGRDDAPGAGPA
jgi:WbqC-like protein family